MKLVILSAGRGQRFKDFNILDPKPLIKWGGKTMIEHVVDNMDVDPSSVIIVKNKEHNIEIDGVTMVNIDYITEGPASTAYLTKEFVEPEDELMVVNCDQIILDWNKEKFLEFSRNYDGVFGTFLSTKPNNSYVQIDENNIVTNVREKTVISHIATNGLHYWKKSKYFYESYEKMFNNKDITHGEYYVAPTFNYMIKENQRIGVFMFNQHYPIGTPEDLNKFLEKKRNENK